MAEIDVSSTQHPGHLVVALRGELDICDAAGLARALSAAAGSGSPIIMDLAGLTFIDCSSLSALACARDKARQAGGDLVLAAPQRQVLRVLSLTFLIDRLPVFASVEEAADAARGPRRVSTWLPEQADGDAPPENGEGTPPEGGATPASARHPPHGRDAWRKAAVLPAEAAGAMISSHCAGPASGTCWPAR